MDQLSPEEKTRGKDNFDEVMGVTRRDFFRGVVAAGAVSGAGLGAMYFGYEKINNPVRIGIIGTGDERAHRRLYPSLRRCGRYRRCATVKRSSRLPRRPLDASRLVRSPRFD
jgi:hypothetical protein